MAADTEAVTMQCERDCAFAVLDAYAESTPHPGTTAARMSERLRSLTIGYHEIDRSWAAAVRSAIGQVERERSQAMATTPPPSARSRGWSPWPARIAATVAGGAIGGYAAAIFGHPSLPAGCAASQILGLSCGAVASLAAWRRSAGLSRCTLVGMATFVAGWAAFTYLAAIGVGEQPAFDLTWLADVPYVALLGGASGLAAFVARHIAESRAEARASR